MVEDHVKTSSHLNIKGKKKSSWQHDMLIVEHDINEIGSLKWKEIKSKWGPPYSFNAIIQG